MYELYANKKYLCVNCFYISGSTSFVDCVYYMYINHIYICRNRLNTRYVRTNMTGQFVHHENCILLYI